ncbi:MAG: hypothetical protein ACK47V_04585 [Betaproteobacteria bacterium]
MESTEPLLGGATTLRAGVRLARESSAALHEGSVRLASGLGFLPNFILVALWLGAVMTAFVFHLRRMPVRLQSCSRTSCRWCC